MTPDVVASDAWAEVVASLIVDFDVFDVLSTLADRCVELFGVSGAGLMLLGPDGRLAVAACSNPTVQTLEFLEQQREEGPCPDCFRSGEPLVNQMLMTSQDRWPHFAPNALNAGFRSVHALPITFRGRILGALNMYSLNSTPLGDLELRAAQALADMATVAIVQHRAVTDAQAVNDQLNRALASRIVIEQAKGILAVRNAVDVDTAFAQLRRYARSHNLRLTEVAENLVAGSINATAIV